MGRGKKIGVRGRSGNAAVLTGITISLVCLSLFAVIRSKETRFEQPPRIVSATVGESETGPAKGTRSFALNIDNTGALPGSIEPGRLIDVTAAFPAGPDGLPFAKTVLKRVKVVGINKERASSILVVSLTPGQAESAAFAAANARLFISICPSGPDATAPTKGAGFGEL